MHVEGLLLCPKFLLKAGTAGIANGKFLPLFSFFGAAILRHVVRGFAENLGEITVGDPVSEPHRVQPPG